LVDEGSYCLKANALLQISETPASGSGIATDSYTKRVASGLILPSMDQEHSEEWWK